MSLEDFQLKHNEPIDKSFFKKRDYSKVYHQQGTSLNDSNQNVEFIFGENNNYHQNGNAYLEFDITVRNTAGNFIKASNIRVKKNPFADCVQEGKLSTTSGSDLEHNKYVGQVSTFMRLLRFNIRFCLHVLIKMVKKHSMILMFWNND